MKQDTTTITLALTPAGWMATFSDPAIARAFGSATVPTAFTKTAPPAQVQRAIAKLNPRAVVVVEESAVTRRDANDYARACIAAGKRPCPVCRDYFYPRNWLRHVKACNGRNRETLAVPR